MAVFKDIFKGIGKAFKGIVSNPATLALTIAGAYVGGGALGMWDTPFESLNGSLLADKSGDVSPGLLNSVSNANTVLQGSGGEQTSNGIVQDLLSSNDVPGSANPSAAAWQAAAGMPPTNMKTGLQGDLLQQAVGGQIAPVMGGGQGLIGGAKDIIGNIGEFAKKNPIAAAMMMNAVAAASQPNAIDLIKKKYELERSEDERKRAIINQNTNIGGVNLGVRPSGLVAGAMR